jgi:signal transduction histidine kinase
MAVAGVSLSLLGFSPYHLDNADSTWRFQIDLSGLAILAFFVAIALHERRQLAARLEQARRLEALGLLAGGVAHDFRNILGAVRGYTEIAEEHLPSHSPALPALHEVVAASHRGRELTDQLLLATRRGERLRDTVDLTDAAQEAVMLARVLPRNGIAITFAPPAHAFHVQAHHGQLVRALLNLIQNGMLSARSAVTIELASGMQAPSPLTMGETPKGKKLAWVSVQDDGHGIAAEHLPRIFEPFFSARDGKETDGKRRASNPAGSGLGLAIVAGIALEHDGGISVTTDDQGTRFCLVVPLIETVPAREGASRHGTSPPPGTKDEPCP